MVWGGEFGRTPFIQGDLHNRKRWGRDHHPYAFTKWLAGIIANLQKMLPRPRRFGVE